MTCPRCHQDAPTIVRGLAAYCTACGAPRPLTTAASAVNVAGQPAHVGGRIAGGLGVAALVAGISLSVILGGFAKLLFATAAALWVGGTILLLTLLVALPLILGGRRLRQVGGDRIRETQEHAIFTLAAQRRGVLTVRDVASALSMREADADALLTAMAKRQDGGVTLEVDDNGGLSYMFPDLRPSAGSARRVRVEAPVRADPPVRVASPSARSPVIVDAELIDEESEQPAARRRVLR